MARQQEQRTKGALWSKALMSFGVLLVSLALAEGGYRIYVAAKGSPYDAAENRHAIAEFVGRMTDRFDAAAEGKGRKEIPVIKEQGMAMIPHPFFAFDFVHKQEQLTRDLEYFERTKGAGGKGKPGFDILILGGSVAAEFNKSGVAHLLELLRADPRFAGRRIREFVYARGSGKQPQQLNTLAYLLPLGFKPDAVINIDGFNEVALANTNRMNGVHPLHPAYRYWLHLNGAQALDNEALGHLLDMKSARRRMENLVEHALRWGLHRSALLGRLTLSRVTETQRAHHDAYNAYLSHMGSRQANASVKGPAFEDDFETTMAISVRSWIDGSVNLQAVCDAHDIYYLHALQPTLHDKGAKPVTPKELRVGRTGKGWMSAAGTGYPLLRAGGEELRARGVNFWDASGVFREVIGDLYYDACHFNEEGNKLLAERMAEVFLARLP
jgi:hypothetical protein